MGERRGGWLRRALWLLPLLAAAGFGWLLVRAQALPKGPVPVVWDKEACAHCRMHIGEPAFAAQLQLADGRVLNFDDPGCLFSYLADAPSEVHAVYFRHHRAERWLPQAEVGFVSVLPTPMGFGLGAVERTASEAKSFDEAQEAVRVRRAEWRGGTER